MVVIAARKRSEFVFVQSGILAAVLFAWSVLPGVARAGDLRQAHTWQDSVVAEVYSLERARVVVLADSFRALKPVTVTAAVCSRSAGGPHDFYSEGDYWWPDPNNPEGPYIRRDGLSNPNNFNEHRRFLIRFSRIEGALAAAYRLTGDAGYARAAADHLRAWFVDPRTRMNPSLLYAQAIKGRVTGRGVGIIDSIHLVEVARAVEIFYSGGVLPDSLFQQVRSWFAAYVHWMTTHPYGIDERERKNNHGTCWVMQVAAFAHLTGNDSLLAYCRERFKTVLLPNQLAADGSFPLELRRTKPYGYSLFNLDAMATVCQILSTPEDNLWEFTLPDGRCFRRAVEFMFPFIQDKSKWPYPPDVMYFDQWPVRHPALLFAALAYREPRYFALWKKLPREPWTEEGMRNFPIRQPVLWVERGTLFPFAKPGGRR